jgi:hypothetical protein
VLFINDVKGTNIAIMLNHPNRSKMNIKPYYLSISKTNNNKQALIGCESINFQGENILLNDITGGYQG